MNKIDKIPNYLYFNFESSYDRIYVNIINDGTIIIHGKMHVKYKFEECILFENDMVYANKNFNNNLILSYLVDGCCFKSHSHKGIVTLYGFLEIWCLGVVRDAQPHSLQVLDLDRTAMCQPAPVIA